MKLNKKYLIGGAITLATIAGIAWWWHKNRYLGELQKLIDEGASIMWFEPHPDDEVHSPGPLLWAGSKGNPCWVVSLIGMSSPPYSEDGELTETGIARLEAINWFRDNYLEDYIMFDMPREQEGECPYGAYQTRAECEAVGCQWIGGIDGFCKAWHGWMWTFEKIKEAYKEQINQKKPDVLITFTPHGYLGNPEGEHSVISNIITEIWHELEYEPKPRLFWFVNTDQGPRLIGPFNEHHIYSPTATLDMKKQSPELEKTYWDAKVEFWWKYAPSVGPLTRYLEGEPDIPPFTVCWNGDCRTNDRVEYFREVK